MMRTAVKLALIFILAFTGVKIWYNRLEENMLASLPAEKVVESKAAEKKVEIRRRKDDYQIIVSRNIFGAALDKKVVEQKPEPVKELQPTKLKLSLMGTVFGNEKDSRAIIADEINRKQDIYAVGDTVQGAQIKSIERRRVVLQVNGRSEILNIKEREGGPVDTALISGVDHAERRSLRDRLSARRAVVRPTPVNRPRPAIQQPETVEDSQFDGGDVPEEYIDEFSDPTQEQNQDAEQQGDPDMTNQEQQAEPEFMDAEPLNDPGLPEEANY